MRDPLLSVAQKSARAPLPGDKSTSWRSGVKAEIEAAEEQHPETCPPAAALAGVW